MLTIRQWCRPKSYNRLGSFPIVLDQFPKQLRFLSSDSPPSSSANEWDEQQEEREILQETAYLARSLCRLCFRSTRLLRVANENDEKEFQQREEKDLADQEQLLRDRAADSRLTFLSMLPPVNREKELASRYEYYCQYTRDLFRAETDCFSFSSDTRKEGLDQTNLNRFVHHLRNGEQQRRWILKDMKYKDPYSKSLDLARIKKLQKRGEAFLERRQRRIYGMDQEDQFLDHDEEAQGDVDHDNEEWKDFHDDEDEDDHEIFQRGRPRL